MTKKLLLVVTALALLAVGAATYSFAAGAEATQTIRACASDNGALHVLAAGDACKKNESALSWNTVGPQGPAGPAGAAGAAGPAGPAGPAGTSAVNPPEPDAVAGTVAITGQQQGAFTPVTLTGISHEIVSPRDAASGLATGKRQHKDIKITKEIDKATPLLMRTLFTNENLTSVVVGLAKGGQQVATVKLTNAHISDYVTHGTTETWSFTYQKIEWTWLDGGITASDDWNTQS